MSEKQSEKKLEILERLDIEVEPKEKEQVRRVVAEVIQSEFSGPIPPPNIIRGYEEVLPGAADRIIAMAEKQSAHRQAMETKIIETESRDGFLGMVFAFSLSLLCIVAAVIIVYLVPKEGGAFAGSLLGVTGIGSIIVTFINSTRSNRTRSKDDKEHETKDL